MPEVKPSFNYATDLVTRVGTWLVILMLGYAISTMQDRYTGTQAASDRIEMRAFIEAIMINHVERGPHDQVSERLARIEIKLDVLADKIKDNGK